MELTSRQNDILKKILGNTADAKMKINDILPIAKSHVNLHYEPELSLAPHKLTKIPLKQANDTFHLLKGTSDVQ